MFARRFFENAPLVGKFPFLKPASFSVAEMKALLEVNKPLSAVVDEAFRCEDVDAWKREDTSEVLVSERIGLGAGYKLDIEARFQPHTDIWGGIGFIRMWLSGNGGRISVYPCALRLMLILLILTSLRVMPH